MKYLVLFLSLTFSSCSSQSKECSKFKVGTFKYDNNYFSDIIIVRNDSMQIEYNSKDDVEIESDIKWISNCEYVLTYKKISNYTEKESVIGKKIFVTILNTDKDSYTAQVVSTTLKTKVKFVKIND